MEDMDKNKFRNICTLSHQNPIIGKSGSEFQLDLLVSPFPYECDEVSLVLRDGENCVHGDPYRRTDYPPPALVLWTRIKILSSFSWSNLLIFFLVICNLIIIQSVKCAPVQHRSTSTSTSIVSLLKNTFIIIKYIWNVTCMAVGIG